jgi:hypothetical protein
LLQNAAVAEPYYRITEVSGSLIRKGEGSVQESLSIVSDFDFATFMEMKGKWMKKIRFDWLVQGHLTRR